MTTANQVSAESERQKARLETPKPKRFTPTHLTNNTLHKMLPKTQRTSTMITFLLIFFLLLRTGFIASAAVVQKKVLETFTAGQTITLECLISQDHENYLYWFKQSLGEAPTCIVSLYAGSGSTPVFFGDFKNDHRLRAQRKEADFALIVTEAKPSDAGIYYCGARDYDLITFTSGLFLNYEGVNTRQYHIDQFLSGLDSSPQRELEFHSGDSVNLHCSVLTERRAGNHSIYWFRHQSGDTHPGIIYKHRNKNDQCEKSSCIYNLPKKNLSLADAGTYYCAVAVCGEILFGNGSRIDIRDFSSTDIKVPVLAATNILCLVIIAVLVCKRTQKRQEIFSENQPLQTTHCSSPANMGVSEDINYAEVYFHGRNRHSETKRSSNTHVVYSSARGFKEQHNL